MLAAVHFAELTAPEQRVLACLIEKRWTTPDQYPLSLNALRLACNQSTNRDPVTDYDEATVKEAAQRLSRYGLARLASGHGSRAIKYRHLAEEALGLGREQLALLAVLMLRGPQTPGELKARTERMATLESLADVERVLGTLAERGYAQRLERRPGQKEDRFKHTFGGDDAGAAADTVGDAIQPGAPASPAPAPAYADAGTASTAAPAAPYADAGTPSTAAPAPPDAGAPPGSTAASAPPDADGSLADRVGSLEAEVAALRAELTELRESEDRAWLRPRDPGE